MVELSSERALALFWEERIVVDIHCFKMRIKECTNICAIKMLIMHAMKAFAWLVTHNKVNTIDMLQLRGPSQSPQF